MSMYEETETPENVLLKRIGLSIPLDVEDCQTNIATEVHLITKEIQREFLKKISYIL